MVRAHIVFASLVALFALGCAQSSDQEPVGPVAVEHMATGTFNSFDQAAGTINITHTPVPSADWPAMTMDFKLADSGRCERTEARRKGRFPLQDRQWNECHRHLDYSAGLSPPEARWYQSV